MTSFFDSIFGRKPASSKIEDPEDPRLWKIHEDRLIKRDIDQLTGICEFAIQDGHIDQAEAESILAWLNNHNLCLDTWPANVLYDRLRQILSDGVLDSDEQGDLLSLIAQISRPRSNEGILTPSALPLDDPLPRVIFHQRNFCFTGVFDFGTRASCHAAILERGGFPVKGVTKKIHYLVIGNIGSEFWKHTSFGLKIAKAVNYRETGVPICILPESHWLSHFN